MYMTPKVFLAMDVAECVRIFSSGACNAFFFAQKVHAVDGFVAGHTFVQTFKTDIELSG
jgi:hypothetical protein